MTLNDRSRWIPKRRPIFISNYYDYEMCYFKRKMNAPKPGFHLDFLCLLLLVLVFAAAMSVFDALRSLLLLFGARWCSFWLFIALDVSQFLKYINPYKILQV